MQFQRRGLHGAYRREGDLVMESPSGRMTQKRPLIYQESAGGRREIGGRYVLVARDTVGLKVDGYDRRRKLVIDPVLAYSTYLGGTQQDQINAVQLVSNGHLYMVGQTATVTFWL